MLKKVVAILILISAYLAVTVALQPKLREVLRAPNNNREASPSTTAKLPQNEEDLTFDCVKGQTVYDLLLRKTGGKVEVKSYSFGKMVNAINGLEGGTDEKYWIFFVDGKAASVSADSYKCGGSEKIEWKFIKPE